MFIIPMVGKSSRFFNEGYVEPKYKLLIKGVSVFEHSVRSFQKYFLTDKFLFLVRSDYDAANFVRQNVERMGILDYSIVVFPEETLGQADTVCQGLAQISGDIAANEPIYIFNIDTFRPGFEKSPQSAKDGYLEVFKGAGTHWSFALAGDQNQVLRTTEKERISDLCSNGLYYFKTSTVFNEAFEYARGRNLTDKGEYYIAPLYNYLIDRGYSVGYELIAAEEIIFCGTPEEYRALSPI